MKRSKAIWGGRMVLAVALLCAATPAAAQVDASRMFRSVFTSADSERPGLLVAATLIEGYGDSPQGYLVVSGDQPAQRRGLYTDLIPGVSYRVGRGRHAFSVSARTVWRASEEDSFTDLGRSAGVGVQSEFGRSAVRIDQSIWTQPYYTFNGIPVFDDPTLGSIPDAVAPEEALFRRSMFVSDTSGRLSHQLGRYLWLMGQYTFRTTSIAGATDELPGFDSREHRAGVSVGRQIGRRTRVGLEYEYRTAGAVGPEGRPVNLHSISIGFDRGQALNLSRHTTMSFSAGPALVQTLSDTGITAAGDLTIRHRMGRTWQVSASARRGLVYADGFERPLMMNGLATALEGGLGRRVTILTSYGQSYGQTDLLVLTNAAAAGNLKTKTLRANTEVALKRYLGVFAEFWMFRQSYGELSTSPEGFDNQRGIRVGLLVKLPMFTQPERGEQ